MQGLGQINYNYKKVTKLVTVGKDTIMKYYGAIEAGGTKFVCSVISDPEHIWEETRFPTTTPEETIGRTIDFFRQQQEKYSISSFGIATFGPVDLNPSSPTYGYITTTPKPGWHNTDLLGPIKDTFGLPCAFDTDVNGAALAEYTWGNPKKLGSLVYYTIGTGVGAGVVINGKPLHGMLHPEAGHMLVRHDMEKDPYAGKCPYHGDCLEGLCAGPTIQERFGKSAADLAEDDPFWDVLANYLAQTCANQVLMLSPEKIVLGGGVMHQLHLFPRIRKETLRLLNGYVQASRLLDEIDDYITPPVLGDHAGVCGAMALAMAAEAEA